MPWRPRHAFLQQKFRRTHDWFGVKAGTHAAALKGVCDRHDHHPLVMRHIVADDRDRDTLRQAGARVVERLVPAVNAGGADASHAFEIERRGGGIDHRRQSAGIGRDDGVIGQAALIAESGTPKLEY